MKSYDNSRKSLLILKYKPTALFMTCFKAPSIVLGQKIRFRSYFKTDYIQVLYHFSKLKFHEESKKTKMNTKFWWENMFLRKVLLFNIPFHTFHAYCLFWDMHALWGKSSKHKCEVSHLSFNPGGGNSFGNLSEVKLPLL